MFTLCKFYQFDSTLASQFISKYNYSINFDYKKDQTNSLKRLLDSRWISTSKHRGRSLDYRFDEKTEELWCRSLEKWSLSLLRLALKRFWRNYWVIAYQSHWCCPKAEATQWIPFLCLHGWHSKTLTITPPNLTRMASLAQSTTTEISTGTFSRVQHSSSNNLNHAIVWL